MKDIIDLTYVKRGRRYHTIIPKYKFQKSMEYLARNYWNFNENSSKLCNLIPKLSSITINQDIIDTQDVPFFEYVLVNSTEKKIFRLVRPCQLVWQEIFLYCDESLKR